MLIVADDLSGAADCAAAFASAGARAFVSLEALASGTLPAGSVVAVDTDSRALPRDEAVDRVRSALERRPAGALVYKKIDSTLRGHLAAELAAALAAMPEAPGAVLAPAFPQQGRTVAGGRCFVNGEPLERTALWRNAGIDEPADPVARLAAAGLPAIALAPAAPGGEAGLAERIAGAFAQGARVAVCDAASPEDLLRLARSIALLDAAPLLAGSAGFARGLAQSGLAEARGERAPAAANRTTGPAAPAAADSPGEAAAHRGPVLTVIGSRAPIARAQAAAIVAATAALQLDTPVERLRAESPATDADDAERAAAIAAALAAGRDVVLGVGEGQVDLRHSLAIARGLARLAAPAARRAAGLVLTGGDTARAVLDALGVTAIEVFGEVEPGVPIARAANEAGLPLLCLKAGGFGSENTLLDAVRALAARPFRT
ncbi:four-carbon acid sugar kinase family protein [Burkholderiaceae bacterium FT117]|uniref:four-carbon acid sugar kinase family protein n=1 Tax=Zeimonas sediminis TaxID=2944268 RepID=UPI0023431A9A|nr:four-carbon acid sugar kinase family protein [Zeimonas sediminis]MCM5571211.1 four-carbon acid sugar kinase family protein [Zeimonas sediminis]